MFYFEENKHLINKRGDKYNLLDAKQVIENYEAFKIKHGYK